VKVKVCGGSSEQVGVLGSGHHGKVSYRPSYMILENFERLNTAQIFLRFSLLQDSF